MTEVKALSGRPVEELTLEAVRQGEIGLEDLRIHPETLERQAAIAEQHENPQLAENLRRAAELTRLSDDEVLAIYATLRSGRATPAELTALAESLAERGLPRWWPRPPRSTPAAACPHDHPPAAGLWM